MIGDRAFWALVIVDIWAAWPFIYMMAIAGLQGIPNEMYEAADIDGASWFKKIRYVALPQIRGQLLLGLWERTDTMATTVRDPQRLLPRWLQVTTIVFLMLWLLPVLYMVIISISPDLEAAAGKMWPSTFVFTNYIDVWSTVPLARGLANSFIASVSAGLIAPSSGWARRIA